MARVYVSSTVADLRNERRAVLDWLVAAGHQPVHSCRPDSEKVRDSCLDDVAGCDLYVLILGHRYGFQPDESDLGNLSITHVEFRQAKELGVPRIALIRTSVPDIRQSDLRDPQRAALVWAFEDEVRGEVRAAEFHDLQGLVQGLSTGVQMQLDKRRARPGMPGSAWAGPVVSVPPLTGLEVARPGLAAHIIDLLRRDGGRSAEAGAMGAVGLTTRVTGAIGAGGFGKTSLARLVAHDPRVLEHFSDGVVWVTVGEEAQGPLLAEKVNEVTARLTGQRPPLTDPVAAGSLLGEVLVGRRLLLVLDDVWSSGQLQPFLHATQPRVGSDGLTMHLDDCATSDGESDPRLGLLVTTRRATVLPEAGDLVTVDAMTQAEADELLTRDLPHVGSDVVGRLLQLTGRWPVLLGLINGSARADVRLGAEPVQALANLADQITAEGPAVLDLADSVGRERAVGATLLASLDRLTADEQARYAELAVFGEDVDIPRGVLERYWAYTAAWRAGQVHQLCLLLLDLGLAAEYRLDGNNPRLRLHDVIRSWLRHRTPNPIGQLDRTLVDAHRDVAPLGPTPSVGSRRGGGCPLSSSIH